MLTRQILHNLPHLKSTAITGTASSPHVPIRGNSVIQQLCVSQTRILQPRSCLLFLFCLFSVPLVICFYSQQKKTSIHLIKSGLEVNNRSECYIIQLFEKKRKTPNAALSLQSALGKMGKKMFKVKFCRQM